jgi:hypothetical protein
LLQLNWFRLHFEGKKLNLVTDGSDWRHFEEIEKWKIWRE